MRRVLRRALPARTQTYLDKRKQTAARATSIEAVWKAARQTKAMKSVVEVLCEMAGARERCMYCVDSHGSDIEHFRPKVSYPDSAFLWSNLLLCCTECGRFKGSCFPLSAAGEPMLVDPSIEDPWECLDFDPDTGNLTARFDAVLGAPSAKGECTVKVLQLDRREAIAEGYRRTFRRLSECVDHAMAGGNIDVLQLVNSLSHADDHGLLGWCFGPIGAQFRPFSQLLRHYPVEWAACEAASR